MFDDEPCLIKIILTLYIVVALDLIIMTVFGVFPPKAYPIVIIFLIPGIIYLAHRHKKKK